MAPPDPDEKTIDPFDLEECDRLICERRRALGKVGRRTQPLIRQQIDALLERRYLLTGPH